MPTPTFTKSGNSAAFSDYIIVGIRTEFEDRGINHGISYEVIREYCIVHLKPIANRLIAVDVSCIYGGNEIFTSILALPNVRGRALVVFNNSLVAIGSSDFGFVVDKGFLKIGAANVDKYDYGYTEH